MATKSDVEAVIVGAYIMSADVDTDAILKEGRENPLPPDEARKLLKGVTERLTAKWDEQNKPHNLPRGEELEAWLDEQMAKRRGTGNAA